MTNELRALRNRLRREERAKPGVPVDMDGSVHHERLKLPPATHGCLSCCVQTSVPEKHRGHVIVEMAHYVGEGKKRIR